jgi:hypothetical protein
MANEILKKLKDLGLNYNVSTLTSDFSNTVCIQNESLRKALSESIKQKALSQQMVDF